MDKPLFETLEYKDLEGQLEPTVTVDEFVSKMGEDDDIIVLSFKVKDKTAAKDLHNWFEKGYDWVLDSETSPGELTSGEYMVFVEMKRRSWSGDRIEEMLSDLETLTEYKLSDWLLNYEKTDYDFTVEIFNEKVPTSPHEYRQIKELELNEMRVQAGLRPKRIYTQKRDSALATLLTQSGQL